MIDGLAGGASSSLTAEPAVLGGRGRSVAPGAKYGW